MYFCSFLTFVDYLNYLAKSLKNIKETFVFIPLLQLKVESRR